MGGCEDGGPGSHPRPPRGVWRLSFSSRGLGKGRPRTPGFVAAETRFGRGSSGVSQFREEGENSIDHVVATELLKRYGEEIHRTVRSRRVGGGSWETFVFFALVRRCESPAPGVLVVRGSQGAECGAGAFMLTAPFAPRCPPPAQLNKAFQAEESPGVIYCISMQWFREWEAFVKGKDSGE